MQNVHLVKPQTFVSQVNRYDNFRVWDKKDACYYHKLYIKLTTVSHSTETEVIECYSAPTNSLQRTRLLQRLKNKGNYIHNLKVLENQLGDLIVILNPSMVCQPTDYLPCRYCYGVYLGKKPSPYQGMSRKRPIKINQKCQCTAFLLTPAERKSKENFPKKV